MRGRFILASKSAMLPARMRSLARMALPGATPAQQGRWIGIFLRKGPEPGPARLCATGYALGMAACNETEAFFMDKLLSVAELAQVLGMTQKVVYRCLYDGRQSVPAPLLVPDSTTLASIRHRGLDCGPAHASQWAQAAAQPDQQDTGVDGAVGWLGAVPGALTV